MNVDQVALRHELVIPHLFQQRGARQDLSFATHHVFEQAEFARQQINRAVPALGGALDEIKLEWAYPEHRIAAFWREECGWSGVLRPGGPRKGHVGYSAPWSEMLIDRAVQTGDQPFDDGGPASRSNLLGSSAIICYTAFDEGPTLKVVDLDLAATVLERMASRVCDKFGNNHG